MIKNAKEWPSVWYGKHMSAGVAEYREPGKEMYRILVNEATVRDMDPTFVGKPVYVRHVESVDLSKIQEEADGYVVESFLNPADNCHWAKFIVVSDKGREAIRNGWRLSNAYVPTQFAQGGISKGVEYQKEVTQAVYEHLALVQDPRYEDSVIMSPEQFKEYNAEKLLELKSLQNSKEKRSMFDFFKKTKVEAGDLESATVKLPKSGREMTVEQIINSFDSLVEKLEKKGYSEHYAEAVAGKVAKEKGLIGKKANAPETEEHAEDKGDSGESVEEKEKQGLKEEEKGAAPEMANVEHHVQVGNDLMSVKDLVASHEKMRDCMNALSEHHAELMKKNAEVDGGEEQAAKDEKAEDLTQRNDEEVDGGEKEAAEEEKSADKTQRNAKHAETLRNAHLEALKVQGPVVDLDKAARGKARYGSGQ